MITSGVSFDSAFIDYKSPVSTSVFTNSVNKPLVTKIESGNINGNASIFELGAHKLEISQCKLPLFNEVTASTELTWDSSLSLLSSVNLSLTYQRML